MNKESDRLESYAQLRRQAEEKARAQAGRATDAPETLSPEKTQLLIHELRVHQIELEAQNEELRNTQVALEAARSLYFDLYDLAPVGYFTLNEKGQIEKANLTAASMLSMDRSELIKQPFGRFILKKDQDTYYRYFKSLLEVDAPKSCALRMMKGKGSILWVRMESSVVEEADGTTTYRVVISDITDYKRAEDAEKKKEMAEAALEETKKLKDQLETEKTYLQEEIKLVRNHENIIGISDALKYVLYKVEQIAATDTTVLIQGETGTGKELIARSIHSLSLRKNRALVKVNCATLPSNLIESELFGHEKGSFTGSHARNLGRFEIANGTTIFLDEIGELPLELQPKLLRVIQDGEFERLGSSHTIKVDARIIAATNRNLEDEVRAGRFREDLWYRLNVFPITMPPLRDRKDDIPLLADFCVKKIGKRIGKPIELIPANVMNALQNYNWPGNVRELENVIERAVINSSGPKLRLADELIKPTKNLRIRQKTLESVERDHIIGVLEQTQWKISGQNSAAEVLGLKRSTLRARMRKLNIQKP
jgi:formate hydrogenlyase transcriptional activator